jgi:hypothetical protein
MWRRAGYLKEFAAKFELLGDAEPAQGKDPPLVRCETNRCN